MESAESRQQGPRASLLDAQLPCWAVLDTNQVLEHSGAIKYLLKHVPGMNCVVPQVVLRELEGLAILEGEHGGAASDAARYVQITLLELDGVRCGGAGERSALVL